MSNTQAEIFSEIMGRRWSGHAWPEVGWHDVNYISSNALRAATLYGSKNTLQEEKETIYVLITFLDGSSCKSNILGTELWN